MKSINIGGVEDEHYRYKMPQLIPKVEGRGNGIKTRIVNCAEIAKALHRPPGYVCKFFGCELGALTQIDDKAGVYIVNGAFDQKSLAELLEKFVKMYVLCENCNLPETTLKVTKSNSIKQSCLACGHSFQVDMMHKLTNYIINNPPSSDGNSMGSSKKSAGMDKKERRKKKAERAEDEAGGAIDREEDAKKEKKSKKKKSSAKEGCVEDGEKSKKKSSKKRKGGSGGDDDEDDGEDSDNIVWATDTSKEAMAARLAEAEVAAKLLEGNTAGLAKMSVADSTSAAGNAEANGDDGEDDEDEEDEPEVKQLKALISEGAKGKALAKAAEEAAAKALGDGVSTEDVCACAAGYVVDAFVTASTVEQPVKLIKALVPVLKAIGVGEFSEAQLQVCNRMDRLCDELESAEEENPSDESDRTIVAQLLKVFYDNEVLTEDALMQWFERESYSDAMIAARKAAKPIVEWVQSMNDDDDDDEDEEDDDDSEE